MENNILGKLFGSNHRPKILRLFVFNPEIIFDAKEAAKRSKVPIAQLRKEINLLKKIDFLTEAKVTKTNGVGKEGARGYKLNPQFPLAYNLKSLLNADFLRERTNVGKRFKNCGRIKLLVISGVFIQDNDTRVDLFIAGDQLKRVKIDKVARDIEAELGQEITYSVLDTKEFLYRFNSNDKFVRDIFDYPHETVIDKISVH